MKTQDNENSETKRAEVMKWLQSAPSELYPEIAQELWPDIDKETALSLFLKKLQGLRRNS